MEPHESFIPIQNVPYESRVTVGPRDLAQGEVTVTRRVDGESWTEPVATLAGRLPGLLVDAQQRTLARARAMLVDRTVEVRSLGELHDAFEERPVFANAPFCNRPACEEAVAATSPAVTVRNLRHDRSGEAGRCVACGEPSTEVAVIARAY